MFLSQLWPDKMLLTLLKALFAPTIPIVNDSFSAIASRRAELIYFNFALRRFFALTNKIHMLHLTYIAD
jgi:hypothetical protein